MKHSEAHMPALLPPPSGPASPVGISLSLKKKRCQVPQEGDEFGVQEIGPTPGRGSRPWKPRRRSLGGGSAWAGGPGRRAHGSRNPRRPPPAVPHAGPLPTPRLLNEPLSVWSLLVLAPSSPWNQAQIPGKANGDRSFEEKESESWKRDQSSIIHSFAHVRNHLFTIILVFGSRAQNRLVHKFHICSCDELPSVTNWKPCKALDCTWSCSLVYFEGKKKKNIRSEEHTSELQSP